MFVIHLNFSYATCSGWLPDPFFRLYLKNVHKAKHGSDTETYDHEGRFVPQRFEDIFAKYADGRDYLTIWDLSEVLKGQRCASDPIGWAGAMFECRVTRSQARCPCSLTPSRVLDLFHAVAERWANEEGKLEALWPMAAQDVSTDE
jgi:hypothetical protein